MATMTPSSPPPRTAHSAVDSARIAIGVKKGSGNFYHEIGHITGGSTNTQQATQTTVETLNQLSRTRTGQPGATTGSLNVHLYMTGPAARTLKGNIGSADQLDGRVIVPESNQAVLGGSGATWTVSSTGKLTAATGQGAVALSALKINDIQGARVVYRSNAAAGTTANIMEIGEVEVDASGVITAVGLYDNMGDPASEITTAAEFCFADPGIRLDFPLDVTASGDWNFTPGQDAGSTINFSFATGLPDATIVVGLAGLN